MKKLLICLALAFSLVTLGACGKNESAHSWPYDWRNCECL